MASQTVAFQRTFSVTAINFLKALTGEWDRHQHGNTLVGRRGPHEDKTAEIAVDENLKALVAADDQRIGRPQRCGQAAPSGCRGRTFITD